MDARYPIFNGVHFPSFYRGWASFRSSASRWGVWIRSVRLRLREHISSAHPGCLTIWTATFLSLRKSNLVYLNHKYCFLNFIRFVVEVLFRVSEKVNIYIFVEKNEKKNILDLNINTNLKRIQNYIFM